jgi:hypothetical protein
VIVGGGFGGLDAARAFDGAPVRVTVVDRFNYHLFQPLLYQVATASLSPGDIASPIRWILRHQANVKVLLANVIGIDVAGRRVLLDPRVVPEAQAQTVTSSEVDAVGYDYLIVAAGAAHTYFGHTEWQTRAPGLKTLDDALHIRRRVLLAFEAAERETDPAAERRLLPSSSSAADRLVSNWPARLPKSHGARFVRISGISGPNRRESSWSKAARACSVRFRRNCGMPPARRSKSLALKFAPDRSSPGSIRQV